MTPGGRGVVVVAAGWMVVAFALLGLAWVAGARVNTTGSMPLGLYWVSDRPVQLGDYVLVCPPQTPVMEEALRRGYLGPGRCPGGYGYVMKRVLAARGDRVAIDACGVSVNGTTLPSSTPAAADRNGRPLPRLRMPGQILADGQVLLMSTASRSSFDSRYFGPVDRRQIETVIVPVFTW